MTNALRPLPAHPVEYAGGDKAVLLVVTFEGDDGDLHEACRLKDCSCRSIDILDYRLATVTLPSVQ